jgi:hypothetical protein
VKLKDLSLQICDTDKFKKWISFFPFMWVKFSEKNFGIGCSATFNFLLPPFSYSMVCVEAEHNKYYKCIFNGLIRGQTEVNIVQEIDGLYLYHHISISGVNKLVHLYYWFFFKPMHSPFMHWRYSVLKKKLHT